MEATFARRQTHRNHGANPGSGPDRSARVPHGSFIRRTILAAYGRFGGKYPFAVGTEGYNE